MPRFEFSFSPQVRDLVASMMPTVKEACLERLVYLDDNPFPRQDSDIVLEAKDRLPGEESFVTGFDHAILSFNVARMTLIQLRTIVYLPPYVLPDPDDEP